MCVSYPFPVRPEPTDRRPVLRVYRGREDARGRRRDDGDGGEPDPFLVRYDLELPAVEGPMTVEMGTVPEGRIPPGWRALGSASREGCTVVFRVVRSARRAASSGPGRPSGA